MGMVGMGVGVDDCAQPSDSCRDQLLADIGAAIHQDSDAAILDQNLKAKTFWRMAVLVPYVVAPIDVGLIFTSDGAVA